MSAKEAGGLKEYALKDGRTFLLNKDDAERMGAKPVSRAVKTPRGRKAGEPGGGEAGGGEAGEGGAGKDGDG
jgi:hypothetical protein